MRAIILLSLLCLFLAACTASPSNGAIATAVEATITARQQRQSDSGLPIALPCNSPELNLGSYEKPVPINTACAIVFNSGEEFTLSISQVLRGKPARELVIRSNAWTTEAPKHMEWVCFYINVDFKDGPSSHDPLYLDGSWFRGVSNASSTYGGLPEQFDLGFNVALFPGDKGEGWVCRPIYTDDENPMVVFGPWEWDIGWYFSLVNE